jgi:hypothetical protein
MKTDRLSEVVERLREGTNKLREERASMSLPDKVREVVKLQEAQLPLIRRRRGLRTWERVWPLRDR